MPARFCVIVLLPRWISLYEIYDMVKTQGKEEQEKQISGSEILVGKFKGVVI